MDTARVRTDSPVEPHGFGEALNWSGYVAGGGGYTSVSGTWIVPTVEPSTELVADATWVGIGGITTRDLIQAGTEAISNEDGSIEYLAWFEKLPQAARIVPLAIHPGDSISVNVRERERDVWEISYTNNTTGESYSFTTRYVSSYSSAEWVEELPAARGARVGLSDFNELRFLSGFAVRDGEPYSIAQAGAVPLRMVNAEGDTLAFPSELSESGGFTVTRTDAVASPLVIGPSGIEPHVVETGVPSIEPVWVGSGIGSAEFRLGPFFVTIY